MKSHICQKRRNNIPFHKNIKKSNTQFSQ